MIAKSNLSYAAAAFLAGTLIAKEYDARAAAPAAQPNILVILADDLGYGELGCQGYTTQIPTPNIDSIAKNGVRFTSGYVSGPHKRLDNRIPARRKEEWCETFSL